MIWKFVSPELPSQMNKLLHSSSLISIPCFEDIGSSANAYPDRQIGTCLQNNYQKGSLLMCIFAHIDEVLGPCIAHLSGFRNCD